MHDCVANQGSSVSRRVRIHSCASALFARLIKKEKREKKRPNIVSLRACRANIRRAIKNVLQTERERDTRFRLCFFFSRKRQLSKKIKNKMKFGR